MDPIDVLGGHPGGALASRPDPRNYQWGSAEIPGAEEPFDWDAGYDVEADIARELGVSGFQLARKNQGQSGSCGGQGMSAYQQALAAFYKRDATEKSAKFAYSQAYVPGGGSGFDTLSTIAIRQGFGLETLTPSYDHGAPPSEAFMEQVGDITPAARIQAAKESGLLAYAYFIPNIEAVAQAMKACKGVSILLRGSNNGTWLSPEPRPPSYQAPGLSNSLWAHYMMGCKAVMRNGVKSIGVLQSWGPNVGENSIQWLHEDYFNMNGVFETGVLVYNPKPIVLPSFSFARDLHQGNQDGTGQTDITHLQTVLAYDGEFNLSPTGYYGPVTAHAVLKFQIKYRLASDATLAELGGKVVGPATRAKLNSLL